MSARSAAPGVSVVIPTNRVDRWLPLAVESLLAQEGVDLEVIVVFDGIARPDTSWTKDRRVRIIERSESGGPSVAMQDGVDIATKEFVARLDSDDVSLPTRLRREADYLVAHPETVAVSCRTVRIDEDGVYQSDIKLPFGPDMRAELALYNVIPHSAFMFRASASQQVGGYDRGLRMMEDYEFILRLACLGPIAQLEDRLVEYRIHSGQTSLGHPARGIHMKKIMPLRRRVGRLAGLSPARIWYNNTIWRAAQFARRARLLKPGHLR